MHPAALGIQVFGAYVALCVLLVLAFQAPLQLLLFAAVDLAGAAWTWHALRKADPA